MLRMKLAIASTFMLLLLFSLTATLAGGQERAVAVTEKIPLEAFSPPGEDQIPDNEFGAMIRYGKQVFTQTGSHAKEYVGNGLSCSNCHLDAGRLAHSAPLWAAWVRYPKWRGKNKMVNTMTERFQGCFRYSMNGTPPPADSKVIKGLMTYSYWLASGAPTNVNLPGQGYPKLDKPAKPYDIARGKQVYEQNCALCHGENGQGTKLHGKYVFPPLWGNDSFNWGAGMHRINTAAAFIHANMPYGNNSRLDVQQAWDVAAYITSHARPQDPRFNGNVAKTKQQYHDHMCWYGDKLGKHIVGAPAE